MKKESITKKYESFGITPIVLGMGGLDEEIERCKNE